MEKENIEELLEKVYLLKESFNSRSLPFYYAVNQLGENNIKELIKENYLVLTPQNKIELTSKGEEIGEKIVRCNRLAECLFAYVLKLDPSLISSNACVFEHVINPEVEQSICTLLGHPRRCPHNQLIPPGKCCKENRKVVKSIILPLKELKVGEKGKIIGISTGLHNRYDNLASLGLHPGIIVTMHQTIPVIVVKTDETTLALDEEIAKEIFVKRIEDN